ncbi:esterase-like activity of phytase family protein [Sulfitobacter sp. TSTF-M16]|uniref:Esterase-like activity of phytase family protein n=2 Tax=Sulfitobacter aestuariivivens TaxID=2766981 RepID=A0A927HGK4_9RHOB|nr:esterase-like activity of phytase family protein [Sulfitobacter aestuariivivens]
MICAGHVARAEPVLELTANVIWERKEPWFGGFSGIEVDAQGRSMTVISDRGRLVTTRMIRDDGRLEGLQLVTQTPLKYAKGGQLGPRFTDAEGLAVGAEGQAYISFELTHRVAQLDPETGQTRVLGGHADFDALQINSGLEALAIDPDGALFALPERSGEETRPFPLYARRAGQWDIAARIPRRGPFLPVGADFDSAGRFYLLERALTPLGFRSRIRRFNLAAPALGEATLLTTGPGRFDNLEGLSIWEDAQGHRHLTLISDDNFYRIQRTQIVEFTLTE